MLVIFDYPPTTAFLSPSVGLFGNRFGVGGVAVRVPGCSGLFVCAGCDRGMMSVCPGAVGSPEDPPGQCSAALQEKWVSARLPGVLLEMSPFTWWRDGAPGCTPRTLFTGWWQSWQIQRSRRAIWSRWSRARFLSRPRCASHLPWWERVLQ